MYDITPEPLCRCRTCRIKLYAFGGFIAALVIVLIVTLAWYTA